MSDRLTPEQLAFFQKSAAAAQDEGFGFDEMSAPVLDPDAPPDKPPTVVGNNVKGFCPILRAVAASKEKFDEWVKQNNGPCVDDGETVLGGRYIVYLPLELAVATMTMGKRRSPDILVIGDVRYSPELEPLERMMKDPQFFENRVLVPSDLALGNVDYVNPFENMEKWATGIEN